MKPLFTCSCLLNAIYSFQNTTTVPPHHVKTKAHVQTKLLDIAVLVLSLIKGPGVRPSKVGIPS